MRYYKAIRPDGTSFHDPTFRWVPETGPVEGIIVAQLFDRQSTLPASVEFNRNYLARFGKASGFGGLTAFDATNVALDAIAAQKRGQTLKEALLARKTFAGVQGPLTFDEYGDTGRMTYLTTIHNGRFVRLP